MEAGAPGREDSPQGKLVKNLFANLWMRDGPQARPFFMFYGSARIKKFSKRGGVILSEGLDSNARENLGMLLEALKACSPEILVRNALRKAEARKKGYGFLYESARVFVLGFGKASIPMTRAAGDSLGWKRTEGLVVTRKDAERSVLPESVAVMRSGHPLPDQDSLLAGKIALEKLATLGKEVPILFLASGGGSSLFESLQEGLSLEDLRKLTEALLKSGASIVEINKVRVPFSRIKGGKLLEAAGNRDSLTLVLSDVVGDDPRSVASGPTVETCGNTVLEALKILDKYRLWGTLPEGMKMVLEKGANKPRTTTRTDRPRIEIIGHNRLLCRILVGKLAEIGYNTLFLGSTITGEAKETGRLMADLAREIRESGNPVEMPAAIVSGGETVVTFKEDGDGKGGPNQEVALSFAIHAAGLEETTLVSIDTDGYDGPTPFAGAAADGHTLERLRENGIDAESELQRHNAAGAFGEIGALIETGSTGNNLNDLRLLTVGTPMR